MAWGRTRKTEEERKLKIAEFKWKVLPLVTKEWQHITVFNKNISSELNPDNKQKWILEALLALRRDGKVESMVDENFPGTYWRLKECRT